MIQPDMAVDGAGVEPFSFTGEAWTDWDELSRHKDDWQALEQVSSGASFFQSYAWAQLADQHQRDDDIRTPFVCAVHQNGRLVALLPLTIWSKTGRKVLTALGEPFVQYSELLIRPDVDPAQVAPVILDVLKTSPADHVHFGKVRASGPLNVVCADRLNAVGAVEGAPFVQLSDWPDFASYYKSVKPKTRKNMRNQRNKLEKLGPLNHEYAQDGELVDQVIERCFAGRSAWLERVGLTSRAFRDAGFEEFLSLLKFSKTEGIELLACSLSLSDKPIAEQWGFVHQGCYYAFMSTWDTEFEHLSPGKLHLGEVIKSCFELNLKAADFMVPEVPYKMTWASGVESAIDYVLPLNSRGWLYTEAWLKFVRPAAKAFAYRLPNGLRKLIVRGGK